MSQIQKSYLDPQTGDLVEILETEGKRVAWQYTIQPGGFKPVLHLHTQQDEIFEILDGLLTYKLNGQQAVAGAGQTVILPKGQPHTHWNAESYPLRMIQSITPALDGGMLAINLFGLIADGKVPNGQPKFLQIMVWLRAMQSRTYLAAIPVWLQDALSVALAPVGQWLGYRVVYDKYMGAQAEARQS